MNDETRVTFALSAEHDLIGNGLDWFSIGVGWFGSFIVALAAAYFAYKVFGKRIAKYQLQLEHDIREHPILRKLHTDLLDIRKRENNLQALKRLYPEKRKLDSSDVSTQDRIKWRKESNWDSSIGIIARLWSVIILPQKNELKSKNHLSIKASLVEFEESEFTNVAVLDAAIAQIEHILSKEYGEVWEHL